MSGLLTALLNFFTNHFNATKLILYGLFVFVLPVVLWNIFVEMVEVVLGLLNFYFSGINPSLGGITLPVSQFGSLAVWMVGQLRIPEALVALVSGLTIRITVDFVMRVLLR